MKKKDFFTVIVKLFGLYLFISTLFSTIPGNIQYWTMEEDWYFKLLPLATTAFFICLIILFLFHAHKVVTFLKLDKGFEDDEINLGNLDTVKILHLGLIIIGGFIFIDHLPYLLTNGYLALKASVQTYDDGSTLYGTQQDYAYLWQSALSVLSGYLILTNYKVITSWMLSRKEFNEKTKV